MPKSIQKKAKARPRRRRIRVNDPVGKPWQIPWDFEVILHDHLGLMSMLYSHNASSLNAWRQCLATCFESFDKVIRDTVSGDARHSAELREWCRKAAQRARKARSHGEALSSSVGDLATLCFRLLGGAAVQQGERRGARRNWSAARHRSFFYTQSAGQMVLQILDHARYWREQIKRLVPDEALPEYRVLVMKRWQTFKGRDEQFLDWFRGEFPRIYVALF